MADFAIIGAGYIHHRHLIAIDALGHQLKLGYDTSSPSTLFREKKFRLTNSETDFYNQLQTKKIQWVSICSPTNTHYAHILQCLQLGCNVIVEKPLCLKLSELETIRKTEHATGKQAWSVFQLRYHPAVQQLYSEQSANKIQMIYKGERNHTYFQSWKGKQNESGGILSAVGIHYFDLFTMLFGSLRGSPDVEIHNEKKSKGKLHLQQAEIEWDLQFYPEGSAIELERKFTLNETAVNLSSYQTNLHTLAYEAIFSGNGVSTEEARKSLEIIEAVNQHAGY